MNELTNRELLFKYGLNLIQQSYSVRIEGKPNEAISNLIKEYYDEILRRMSSKDLYSKQLMKDLKDTCQWILTDADWNTYKCDKCGLVWQLTTETPKDNEMFYCPKCGRKLL